MAPHTLNGWLHPYRDPFTCYADGGDEAPADDAGVVEVEADTDETPVDDWTPPSRDEYEQLIAAKKKADGEAAARRKYLRAHGIDPKTGVKERKDDAAPPDAPADDEQQSGASAAEMQRAIEKAAAEAELKGRRQTRALVTGVNAALAEAGWNGQRLNSLMKLIDLDDVDIESDGEISGLSEQIESIRSEWPEFFKRTRNMSTASNGASGSGQNGVTAAKVEAADKKPPAPEPKDWAEVLAARALRS